MKKTVIPAAVEKKDIPYSSIEFASNTRNAPVDEKNSTKPVMNILFFVLYEKSSDSFDAGG